MNNKFDVLADAAVRWAATQGYTLYLATLADAVELIRQDRIVAAIKLVRAESEPIPRVHRLVTTSQITNRFSAFVCESGLEYTEQPLDKMGLKDAKDIVDVFRANM